MMLSMTGFGRAEYEDKNFEISVEIKSLNHRHLEVSLYLPEGFGIFEGKLREKVAQGMKRGRIFLYLNYLSNVPEEAAITVNKNLAKKAVQHLKHLGHSLNLGGKIEIKDILALPNIVKVTPRIVSKSHLWPAIDLLVEKAIKDLVAMRRKEGLFLLKDIASRIKHIQNALKTIQSESPRTIKKFEIELRKRLKDRDFSREKLVEEVGVFARNIDISEEVVRLKSHLNNFRNLLNNQSLEKGRTLDFIAQEMQREINTIGSKSASIQISQRVVVIKSEIDKIREQLSNVE